jgi:hypothetical protein
MIRGILAFFIFVSTLLLLLVYFMGDYSLDFGYLKSRITAQEIGERDLILDQAVRGDDSYYLRVTTRGEVNFQKNIETDRDFREFRIESQDLEIIKNQMNRTGVFKIFSLDRNYCFNRYEATINFDFGWIHKDVKYSNCNDDPSEVKNFRKFLYNFLGLQLEGT